jgi:hypothetical protein
MMDIVRAEVKKSGNTDCSFIKNVIQKIEKIEVSILRRKKLNIQ